EDLLSHRAPPSVGPEERHARPQRARRASALRRAPCPLPQPASAASGPREGRPTSPCYRTLRSSTGRHDGLSCSLTNLNHGSPPSTVSSLEVPHAESGRTIHL